MNFQISGRFKLRMRKGVAFIIDLFTGEKMIVQPPHTAQKPQSQQVPREQKFSRQRRPQRRG